mmetsp:Transcript_49297/g.81838  ORF Transcript_49297/g.81838 Transcript_49297/m.81838 type:complete len:445 (-) Transcript_49297:294-1628(-)
MPQSHLSKPINVSLGLAHGWIQHSAPQKHYTGLQCSATCDFQSRCYDQRIPAVVLCAEQLCCGCQFCTAGPVTSWTTPEGVILESLTTRTTPSFQYVYNPLDQDMLYIRHRGLVEPSLTGTWIRGIQKCCAAPHGLVVDVGANFGWYTLLSLALDCAVVAFEPVRAYQDVLKLGVHLNGPRFAERLTLYGNAVFERPGNFSMVVPRAGVIRADAAALTSDTAASGGSSRDSHSGSHGPRPATLITHMRTMLGMAAMLGPQGSRAVKDVTARVPGTSTYQQPVQAVRIDSVVEQPVCMLKIDIEGLEPQGLVGAHKLLSLYPVEVVQLEVTKKSSQACRNVRMLTSLLLQGFALNRLNHLRACWESSCVRAHLTDEASKLSQANPAGSLPHKVAARMARAIYAKVTAYSWNLIAYRNTRPPGRLLTEPPYRLVCGGLQQELGKAE